jgi:hypothetical protein
VNLHTTPYLTPSDLYAMSAGREESEWWRTASLRADIAALTASAQRAKSIRVEDFHPMHSQPPAKQSLGSTLRAAAAMPGVKVETVRAADVRVAEADHG